MLGRYLTVRRLFFDQHFTCDQKGVNIGPCVNQLIVDKVPHLLCILNDKAHHCSWKNSWRYTKHVSQKMTAGEYSVTGKVHQFLPYLACSKKSAFPIAIRAIRNYPKKIQSFEEAKAINGIGEKTARKVSISHMVELKMRRF